MDAKNVREDKLSVNKYRLVLFNNRTHRRLLWLSYSPLAAWLAAFFCFAALAAGFWCLVAYTPLRHYVPGYPNEQMLRRMDANAQTADSLRLAMQQWELQLENLRRILADRDPLTPAQMRAALTADSLPRLEEKGRSQADSTLRRRVESLALGQARGALQDDPPLESLFFFPPVKGIVSDGFDPSIHHYAADIAAPGGAVVSAVLDGTVVTASWMAENGYVVQVQHGHNLLSVYKHCASLFCAVGDQVKAGTAIGAVGGREGLSTGNHLHFELWYKGTAVDPVKYVRFQ